ncbi:MULTISPECIES: VOC family protein [unclassified Microcella]|uniref:VOC family protein n=1 Tax=unclassified Microcella TaxID=2630066 RepID=UPI0006F820C5|nr:MULTISPECIES: VOC family protein [unclassified Microcella]KQV25874.1 hypothetical protein ASC54_02565 [Yonghaparkia sp. Root332]KRF33317.1 hypothetical protein ASG83_05065 [Yonghaparkia sp. Soil809]
MTDRANPALPARDLAATAEFYGRFGFHAVHHDESWLRVRRGRIELEFFPHADLDPTASAHQCVIRVGELDALHAAMAAAGVPQSTTGIPRLTPIAMQAWGRRAAFLVDLDGSQLALVEER